MDKLTNIYSKNKIAVIAFSTVILVAIIAVISYLILERVDKKESSENEIVSAPISSSSEPISSAITPEKDLCTKTYSNSYFPTIHFDYDSCFWTLSEELVKEFQDSPIMYPDNYIVTLTDVSNSKLVIQINPEVAFGLYGGANCQPKNLVKINDEIARNTSDNTMHIYFPAGLVAEKGTPQFEELKNLPYNEVDPLNITTESTACVKNGLSLSTKSEYSANDLGQGMYASNPDAKIYIFISPRINIDVSMETLEKADEVIKTLQF